MTWWEEYLIPSIVTVVFHALVIVLALWGWRMSSTEVIKQQVPNVVEARLVTIAKETPRPRPAKPAPKPVPKPRPQPKPKPEPKAAVKTAPKPAPKPEPKPVSRPKPQPKPQTQKSDDNLKKLQQKALAEAMAQDSAQLQAASDRDAADSYGGIIKRAVEANWSRPPSARKGMQVTLSIHLIPTGEVVGVTVIQGSGNAAFDRSAINAVKRAGSFPQLQKMPSRVFERYFRQFTLVFKPEDLSQ